MDTSRIRTNLLRGGVSLAALAAAWGMPTAVQAQTCRTAVAIDGVAAGTDVTCPFSDVLTFPGGISQGPGGVPNGSQLLGVFNGTDPTHQQWNYNDPNGVFQFIFLSGDYNLRNGVGGTTVLEGAALRTLSGAGLCGVGGQLCTPGGVPTAVTSNFSAAPGGGAGGTFLGQPILDPFVGNGGFQQASADASGQAICDAMPAGASCGGSFHYGPAFDASTTPGTGAPESSPDLTISGLGFDDYLLDLEALPDDVAEDYRSCSQSGASACAVVFDDQGTPFVYGPDLAGGAFERVPVAPLVIVTDGQGNTAADFGYTWNVTVAPEGAGYDLGGALRQHEANAELLQVVPNLGPVTGAGAQGTFSIPGLADGFLLTQDANGNYVISVPVKNAVDNTDGEDGALSLEMFLAPAAAAAAAAAGPAQPILSPDQLIGFDTQKIFDDAQKVFDASEGLGTPTQAEGAATAGALAFILSLDAPALTGAQASQASDARTAGVPLPDGDRRDLFGPSQ